MITYKSFSLSDYADVLIVTDANVARLYGIEGDNVLVLPAGEQTKSFSYLQMVWRWFLAKGLHRNGRVVAVGGGVVGDLVGFAASVFMRGVSLTHVPTTLLAQIDSSIGGKTAINLCGVKNVVGSFVDADTVIDTSFLQTLPQEQLQSGYGEVLKYRMLSDSIDGLTDLDDIIKACVDFKCKICAQDKLDTGSRRVLNLGHTVGHAMELQLGIPHGIAVANGLYYETQLSYRLGRCGAEYKDKWQRRVAEQFEIYPLTSKLLSKLVSDKKNVNQNICFSIPTEQGVQFVEVPLLAVKHFLL